MSGFGYRWVTEPPVSEVARADVAAVVSAFRHQLTAIRDDADIDDIAHGKADDSHQILSMFKADLSDWRSANRQRHVFVCKLVSMAHLMYPGNG